MDIFLVFCSGALVILMALLIAIGITKLNFTPAKEDYWIAKVVVVLLYAFVVYMFFGGVMLLYEGIEMFE